MKLTLAEPKYLKDSVTIISELVNEAHFKITKDAIELVAMDPANVAMVIFKLLASSFTEYKVEKDTEITINLSQLKQILRRAGANDTLTLELVENKLKVTLKGRTKRAFSLPLIEAEDKEQKVPDLKFPTEIRFGTTALSEAIDDADVVAESVTFVCEKDKLSIFAEGDLSKAEIEIPSGEDVKIKNTEKTKAKYSIEYLKKMVTGSKLADDVVLYFNNDYPMKLEYRSVDKVYLAFILAPRVEND